MINFTMNLLKSVEMDLELWNRELDNKIKVISEICRSTIKRLEQEIKNTEVQIKQIKSELVAADDAISTNQKNKQNFENEISFLRRSIAEKKAEIENLSREKNNLENDQKSAIERRVSKLKQEIDKDNKRISELKEKIAKININNNRIMNIKSNLNELIKKCMAHIDALKTKKYKLNDALSYFVDDFCPRLMSNVSKTISSMKHTISLGANISSCIINLACRGHKTQMIYDQNSVEINIPSYRCFYEMSNKLQIMMEKLDLNQKKCKKDTEKFTYKLRDKVSYSASIAIRDMNKDINSEKNYFNETISKLETVYQMCSSYELIDV